MKRVELPTLGLMLGVYGAWLALTWHHDALPFWTLVLAGGWLAAWHASLQHEAIHGHPTSSRRLNAWLARWPIGWLWLPFDLYRDSHLAHHGTRGLTVPGVDPESSYVSPELWTRLPRLARAVLWANQTVLGRLVLGPPLVFFRFVAEEVARLARGDASHLRAWRAHLGPMAAVLAWALGVCGLSLGEYLLAFVYPGVALTLLRSYTEHRPGPDVAKATAVVESSWPLSLLFLHNNLHSVHHAEPGLAWYRIPARYHADRTGIAEANGHFVFGGYREVMRRYALRPKDSPIHPQGGAP